MRSVPFIDSTGINVLRDLVRRTQADGTAVIIAEAQEQPRQVFDRSGLVDLIGSEHLVASLDVAIAMSGQIAENRRKTRPTPAA